MALLGRLALGIVALALAGSPKDFGLKVVKTGEDGTILYDKRGKAEIFLPKDYELVAPVSSRQVTYDFGMRHRTEAFEVRVRFDKPLGPSAQQRKEFEKSHPGSEMVSFVDQGEPSVDWALTMVVNLGGIPDTHFELFPPKAVKKEFGADWGVTSEAFPLKDRDFAGKYDFARIVAQVHKKDVGSYTVFQLFSSLETDGRLRNDAFHIVKFRPK